MWVSLVLLAISVQEPEYPDRFAAGRPYRGKGIHERLIRPAWGYPQTFHPRPLHQSTEIYEATLAGLQWLARNQRPDGSWNPGQEEFRAAVTGLALLAFLAADHTPACTETYGGPAFGGVIRRGLQWILPRQDLDGCVGPRGSPSLLLNHLICAQALSEAYARYPSLLFLDPAERAIDFTLILLTDDPVTSYWASLVVRSSVSWRYSYKPPVLAIEVARAGFNRLIVSPAEAGSLPVETAGAVTSQLLLDPHKGDHRLANACDRLLVEKPSREEGKIDFSYWHWGTLALFRYDGPSGPKWKAWSRSLNEVLLPLQCRKESGENRGSWDPLGPWSAEGGRAWATALNALTLGHWSRFPIVFFAR